MRTEVMEHSRTGSLVLARLYATIAMMLASALAWPETPVMSLNPGQTQFSIPLTLDLSRQPDSIAVELDGYDVSAFASPGAHQLTLSLETPLPPGRHEVILLASYPDGSIETLLTQALEVTGHSLFSPANWAGNLSLETSYLAHKEKPEDFAATDHLHTGGGTSLTGTHSHNAWQFGVQMDALYNSDPSLTASGDEVDLATYRVGTAWQNQLGLTKLQAGDYLVGTEGLIFSSFRRRGLAVQHATKQQMVEVEAFALKSDTTANLQVDTLFPVSEDRVAGGRMVYRPLDGDNQPHLQLSASYLDGETTYTGLALSEPEDAVYKGHVTGVGALSEWLDGGLGLEAQFARSSFDFDGIGEGLSADDDKASLYSIRLASGAFLPVGPLDQWSLRLVRQSVGRYFYSLGNRYLPGDLTSNRAELFGSLDGFSFGADLTRATNNVDRHPLIADFTHRSAGLQGYYTPSTLTPDDPLWRLLGTPSLEGSLRRSEQVQDREDAELNGYDINNRTDEVMAGITFSYPQWQWALQQTRIELDDHSRAVFLLDSEVYSPPSDSVSDLTLLRLTFQPSPYFYLAPLAQYQRYAEADSRDHSSTLRFGIDGQAHLRRDKLILNLSYSQDRDRRRSLDPLAGYSDNLFRSASGQLLWKALAAHGIQPGFDLFTRGSYGSFRGDGSNNTETWQILVGVSAVWED